MAQFFNYGRNPRARIPRATWATARSMAASRMVNLLEGFHHSPFQAVVNLTEVDLIALGLLDVFLTCRFHAAKGGVGFAESGWPAVFPRSPQTVRASRLTRSIRSATKREASAKSDVRALDTSLAICENTFKACGRNDVAGGYFTNQDQQSREPTATQVLCPCGTRIGWRSAEPNIASRRLSLGFRHVRTQP